MPVLGRGLPVYSARPSVWPRMVSTAAWQSVPTVKPGPTPITTGASVRAVPKFFFARIASTTAPGRRVGIQAPAGSARTATTPD